VRVLAWGAMLARRTFAAGQIKVSPNVANCLFREGHSLHLGRPGAGFRILAKVLRRAEPQTDTGQPS
jgi:hypothetical protein